MTEQFNWKVNMKNGKHVIIENSYNQPKEYLEQIINPNSSEEKLIIIGEKENGCICDPVVMFNSEVSSIEYISKRGTAI